MDATQEAGVLLFIGDGEPVFDQLDAAAHQHFFKLRHGAEELFVFFIVAKAHDLFNTRAVVPTAVKQHDLARSRQMRDVALEVPLGFFPVVGRRQSGHTAHTGIQALGDAFDDAAFARCVTAFKQNDHAVTGFDHPVLQHHQLGLKAQQLTKVSHPVLGVTRAGAVTIEQAVVQLQLHLFVHAVEQIFAQLAQLFFGDFLGHGGRLMLN